MVLYGWPPEGVSNKVDLRPFGAWSVDKRVNKGSGSDNRLTKRNKRLAIDERRLEWSYMASLPKEFRTKSI